MKDHKRWEADVIEFETGQAKGHGYLAVPAAGSGPGVLVLHAWWGLTPFFTSVCDRLAAEGFVVLAPDLHDGQTATTAEEAEALVKLAEGPNQARTQALATSALAQLRAHPAVRGTGVGVMGFSFGAAWAITLATQAPQDVAAVVLFYGTYVPDFSETRAVFQGHFAEHDEWEPAEGVQALEAALSSAGREVTFHTYPDTGHWFFESDRPDAFQAEAAALAWARTLDFLRRAL
jgi:carboxymethylenebutenolidase